MDYIIDAIDIISDKLDLIETSHNAGVKLFSSMGMALKLDPTRIKTASIWDTHTCPLARAVREGLRGRGFQGDFTAVYSDEQIKPPNTDPAFYGKRINGNAVPVTASAGMILASLVLRDVSDNIKQAGDT